MQEYPDNDQPHEGLDGLFRKSAEEFEPTFDPAAWQDMRARLEEHDRKVLMDKWLIRSSILLVVLLLGFVGWYSWEVVNAGGASVRRQPGPPARAQHRQAVDGPVTTKPTTAEPESGVALNAVPEASGTPPSVETGKVTASRRTPERVATVAEQARNKAQTANAHTAAAQVAIARTAATPVRTNQKPDNQSISLITQPSDRPVKESGKREKPAGMAVERVTNQGGAALTDRQERGTALPVGQTGGSTTAPKPVDLPPVAPTRRAGIIANPDVDPAGKEPAWLAGPDSADQEAVRPVLSEVDRLKSHSFVWPLFTSLPEHPVLTPEADHPVHMQRPKLRGFSLRAMVSPDLTTIGLQDFVRPGVNLGLLLEYRLSNRWSIQAGTMWSKKVYEAYPDQYEWPSNWKWQVPVLGVDGICSMVDIPLNVRYDVVLQPRKSGLSPSRWFVNAGVTSFVMLREVYNYQYANPDDPRIKFRQWAGKTGLYGLSHLNISVGYERALTRRWAWQIEPFIKAPVQGVGRFNIHLISTGTFLSVRYKL